MNMKDFTWFDVTGEDPGDSAAPVDPVFEMFRQARKGDSIKLGRVSYQVIYRQDSFHIMVYPSNRKNPVWLIFNGGDIEIRKTDGGGGNAGTLISTYVPK
jgi:hypothetical protein